MKFLTLFFVSSLSFAGIQSKYDSCHTAKEYITTYNFLKSNKIVTYKSSDLRKISNEVSKGCLDSAKRFINVYKILTRAGVETSDAAKLAIELSKKTNMHSEAFLAIFKESFLKDYLDLSIRDSLNLSKKLSFDLTGSISKIKSDFQNTVKFCLDENELNLNGGKCAAIALKVATSGSKYNKKMYPSFRKLFNYINTKEGTNLPTYKALSLSLKVIDFGPTSFKNFKDGFEFAAGKNNLAMTNMKAIEFATTMAQRSSILKLKSKSH